VGGRKGDERKALNTIRFCERIVLGKGQGEDSASIRASTLKKTEQAHYISGASEKDWTGDSVNSWKNKKGTGNVPETTRGTEGMERENFYVRSNYGGKLGDKPLFAHSDGWGVGGPHQSHEETKRGTANRRLLG